MSVAFCHHEQPEKKEINEESKLPEPTGWRILVLPFKQKGFGLNAKLHSS